MPVPLTRVPLTRPINARCDLRFYALKASKHLANMLSTDENEALFVMDRTTWIGSDPITSVKAVTMPGYQLLTHI